MVRKNIEIKYNVMISILLVTLLYTSNLISYVLSFEEYKNYFIALRYIITIFVILTAFTNLNIINQHRSSFIFSGLLLILSIITKNSFYLDISILILFSVSLYKISYGRLHTYLGLISIPLLLLFCCFVFFSLIGHLDNQILKQPSSHLFSIKSSLGFVNPNVVSMLICTFTIVLLIYKRYLAFSLFFIIFSFSSIFLGSRTYIFALIFSIIIVVFKKQIKKINYLSIIALTLPLLIAISLFFNIESNQTLMLDLFLNGRIYGFNEELNKLNLLSFLFGFGDFEKIDSVYFNIILAFGVIGYLFISMFFYYILIISKNDNTTYCLAYCFLFICFFENILTINSILSVLFIYQFILKKQELSNTHY